MKALTLTACLCLFAVTMAAGQVTLVEEDFETDGEGTRYTGTFNDAACDFFEQSANPAACYASPIGGINGSGFLASEDVDGGGMGINPNHPIAIVTLNTADVSGFENFQVSLLLAEGKGDGRFEGPEMVEVQYAFDGDIGTTYTTIGRFMADPNLVGGFGGFQMSEDEDLNGTPDGNNVLTPTMASYTFDVGATGTNLSVRVAVTTDGGSEEIAMDLIRILGDTVLPVELSRFEALVTGEAVLLQWATAGEVNNAGFEVQHEAEGRFASVGFVEGAGTTTEAQAYAYPIDALDPGQHRFRIKQLDADGTARYSHTVEVFIEMPDAYRLSNAYPNPFNPQTQFTLALGTTQHVQVVVFDLLGRPVAQLFEGRLEADQTYSFTFDAAGLPSGTYLYRVTGEGFTTARPVVLLK